MPILTPIRFYTPGQPYNSINDNFPISDIATNINLLNGITDANNSILQDSIGTQGSLNARLNVSINPDGSLKSVAINNALHSIADHIDAGGFVRFTSAERSKLSLIADEATNMNVGFQTISNTYIFSEGLVLFGNSSSINWSLDSQDIVRADVTFPPTTLHTHYYSRIAVPFNYLSPDYITYKTTSTATPYQSGSLRVTINGYRLNKNATIKVPIGISSTPTAIKYSEDNTIVNNMVTTGKFTLSTAITIYDNIVVDWDVLYT